MPEVILAKCSDYSRENVKSAMSAIFSRLDTSTIFKNGEKILLKPNLLSARAPEKAVTTHPEIMRAVAGELNKLQLKLSFGDSPAKDSTQSAVSASGIGKVMKELCVLPADFKNTVTIDYPDGKVAKSFQFAKAFADNDGIVNVCKFKTHALTKYTGAIKNLFGLIPGLSKAKDHVRFPDEMRFTYMLADLNKCASARLHITDAVVGMEGNGPSGGEPRQIGWIMASTDPVALDSVCVLMMGLNYKGIPMLRTAKEVGLGEADPELIQLIIFDGVEKVTRIKASDAIESLILENFKQATNGNAPVNIVNSAVGTFLKRFAINRPVIDHEKCTTCKVCVDVCPLDSKAIYFSKSKGKIIYKYAECIRCFCCQELCPQGVISVKKAPLNFLIRE